MKADAEEFKPRGGSITVSDVESSGKLSTASKQEIASKLAVLIDRLIVDKASFIPLFSVTKESDGSNVESTQVSITFSKLLGFQAVKDLLQENSIVQLQET